MPLLKLLLLLVTAFSGLASAVGTPKAGPPPQPPAGRAILYRGAVLQPWDFPESVQADFDPVTHSLPDGRVLGPPGFWTEPSLRAHYAADINLRYHPAFFPTPPPFQVWLKEKKIIAAINLLGHSIQLETQRLSEHPSTYEDQLILLEHEIQMGELTVLLRVTQIATVLRYAKLDPDWMKYEESWYRHYSSLLEVGKKHGRGTQQWKEHVEYVQKLGQQQMQEMQRMEAEAAERERQAAQAAQSQGKKVVENGSWRQIPVERGDLQSSTPRSWVRIPRESPASGSRGETSGIHPEELAAGMEEDITKSLREAFGKAHI